LLPLCDPQIELRITPLLKRVSRALKAAERARGPLLPGVPSSDDEAAGTDGDADADDGDADGDDDVAGGDEDEAGEDEEDEDEDDDFPLLRAAAGGKAKPPPRLPTEDAFFKLGDMERFVQDAEDAEAMEAAGPADDDVDGEEDESDDDADLFAPGSDEEEGGAARRRRGGAGSDDDEDDLDAAVAFTAGIAGGSKAADKARAAAAAAKAAKGKAKKGKGGGGGEGIMYEDFFGPRPAKKGAGDDWGDQYRDGPPAGGDEDDEGGAGGDDGDEEGREYDEEGYEMEDADEEADGDEDGAGEEGVDRGIEPVSRGRGGRRGLLSDSDDDGDGSGGSDAARSKHARRAAKLAEQAATLEEANVGTKPWHMRGEAKAGDRPLNSALEIALDFEHAQLPAPVVTAETTANLEALIRARCAEARFDDVQRRLAPAPGKTRKAGPLSDEKSTKGLAELYEEEYLKERAAADAAAAAAAIAPGTSAAAAAAAAELEADTPLAREARALFAALCGKLDALSHFQFAPKPFVPDLEVTKKDLPALALEEVAPAAVSTASLRAPREVYAGGEGAVRAAGGARGSAAGTVKAEAEFTREERVARRQRKKRKGMAATAERDAKRAAVGRLRAAQDEAAAAAGFKTREPVAARQPRAGADRSDFGKSAKVFAGLQDAKEAAAAAGADGGNAAKRLKERAKAATGGAFRASALKL